ncbi:MAG: response regulator [Bacteroidota bacterium]
MKNINILIVEDEKLIALSLKRNLTDDGINVMAIADEGNLALELVHELKPDLVIMDVMIKGDLTGVDVSEKIREFSSVPIIFTSAVTTDDILTRAKAVRPYGYLVKPVNYDELKVSVEIAVSNYKYEQDLSRQKKFFCSCMEAIPAGVAIAGPDGNLLCCNHAFCLIAGGDPATIKGKNIRELMPCPEVDSILECQTEIDVPGEFPIVYLNKEGLNVPAQMNYNRVDDDIDEGILHIFSFPVEFLKK